MTVSHSDAWILGGIQVVARKHVGWRGEIRPDLRIVEALALDSLRLLTLVVVIENHFRICLDDETEARIETVRDLVEAIRTPAPPGFPLRLLSLVRRSAIHSQILPADQAAPPPVWVAPECAVLGRIDPGRPVALVSPLGLMTVTVRTLPGLHPAEVVYRRGDWMSRGGGVNRLIRAGLTGIGGGAAFYDQYVTLENG